jgi:hypothetical protein
VTHLTKMRYKIVACILLILSVFSFVLAAPVPVPEIREAVEGGENVIIVSEKRAAGGNPNRWADSDSDSDTEWATPSPQSSQPPDHASGSHPGVDTPSTSGGSVSPLWSKVWSTPGGAEVPLDPEGAFKPGTTTPKKVNFWHTTKVHIFEPDLSPPPEDQPAKKALSVSWGPSQLILPSGEIISEPLPPEPLPSPPGREAYLAKMAAQQSPSSEHASPSSEHASPSSDHSSSSSDFDLYPPHSPEHASSSSNVDLYPPQSPEHASSSSNVDLYPPPESKGFASKFKTFFGKLKFRPRFQRTVDTGA